MKLKRHLIAAATGFACMAVTWLAVARPAPASTTAAGTVSSSPAVHTYTGQINGASYRAEVPDPWNGNLVMWSHSAYYYGFTGPSRIELTNQEPVEGWLTSHGYAVAGSQYLPNNGWAPQQAMTAQMSLLRWFDQHIGRPRHTVAEGADMGGVVSIMLAEHHPAVFNGALSLGSQTAGSVSQWNLGLDLSFAFRTLLAPHSHLQMVHISHPSANLTQAQNLITAAQATPQGRARLALIGALGDVSPRWSALHPVPATLTGQLAEQEMPISNLLRVFLGGDRAEVEHEAGGNPSWNTGVNYTRLFATSSQRRLAERAYAAAGLNLRADVSRLNAAPRITADARAVRYLARYGDPLGTTPVPEITVHTTGDGFSIPQNERQYAALVARYGQLRNLLQLFVDRGGHTTVTASEEIVALQTIFQRITTGHWPSTSPRVLNAAAARLGPGYQKVFDWASSGQFGTATPAFTKDTPGCYPRPFLPPAPSCQRLWSFGWKT